MTPRDLARGEFLRKLGALVEEYEGGPGGYPVPDGMTEACPLCRLGPVSAAAAIATSGSRFTALMAIAMHAIRQEAARSWHLPELVGGPKGPKRGT